MVETIAILAYRAALNEKLLQLAGVFGILLMILSVSLGELGPLASGKIIADFGLGAMHLAAVLVAITLGSQDLPRELERRTLYVVLSKPVDRTSLIAGKFLGLALAIWTLFVVMGALFYAMLMIARLPVTSGFMVAIGMSAIEATVVASIAMFFSLLTSSTLAALYSLLLFFMGHQTGLIRTFGYTAGGATRVMTEILYRVIPNFEALNLRNEVVYGLLPSPNHLLVALAYGVALATGFLGLSVLVFRRKEL